MRIALSLLLLTGALWANTLTVVGLSGKQYTVNQNSDTCVDFTGLLKKLNFRHTTSKDTLTVNYNSHKMALVVEDSITTIDSVEYKLNNTLFKDKDTFRIKSKELPRILSLVTKLSFRYEESSNILSIHREPAEYLDLTGTIVLDPGHGGKDPGAIGQDSTYEKEVVLAISLKTAEYIKTYSGLDVHLTRDSDTFIPLRERTTFANEKKADLFVSVHANSSPKMDNVGGYKMYFLSDAKSEADERIAMFENSVMELEEADPEADILQTVLMDMINNEYLKESQELSITLEESFHDEVGAIDKLHTGVGQANFFVLNGALMPSVLVEVCFISNSEEEKLLVDEKFQNKVAHAMGKAILAFRKKQRDNYE